MRYLVSVICLLFLSVVSAQAAETGRWSRGWPVEPSFAVSLDTIRVLKSEQSRWKVVAGSRNDDARILRWHGRFGPGLLQLNHSSLTNAPTTDWMRMDMEQATNLVIKNAQARIDREFVYGATITLSRRTAGGINIQVEAPNRGAMQLAHQLAKRILAEERVQQNQNSFLIPLPVFHGSLKPGQKMRGTVYFDMDRLSGHYAQWVSGISADLVGGARKPSVVSARLLDFLQSISYRGLEKAEGSNGIFPPDQMLSMLEGDCDSKSLFWLAAMRRKFPSLPLISVVTHNHAFVGRALLPGEQPTGTILPIGNHRFLLSEPVGPALIPEGVLAGESLASLKRGLWHHQIITD